MPAAHKDLLLAELRDEGASPTFQFQPALSLQQAPDCVPRCASLDPGQQDICSLACGSMPSWIGCYLMAMS